MTAVQTLAFDRLTHARNNAESVLAELAPALRGLARGEMTALDTLAFHRLTVAYETNEELLKRLDETLFTLTKTADETEPALAHA